MFQKNRMGSLKATTSELPSYFISLYFINACQFLSLKKSTKHRLKEGLKKEAQQLCMLQIRSGTLSRVLFHITIGRNKEGIIHTTGKRLPYNSPTLRLHTIIFLETIRTNLSIILALFMLSQEARGSQVSPCLP